MDETEQPIGYKEANKKIDPNGTVARRTEQLFEYFSRLKV
jgi:hypothetical protein